MATRNSSRPAPGHPSGNAENILSSGGLLHNCVQSRSLAHKMNPYCSESFRTTFEVGLDGRGFGLELNNSPAHSDGDRLRAITGAELFHDVFDMHLHSLLGDKEFVRDIPVTISAGNLGEHFNFASGECFVTIMFGQMGCDLRWNTLLAAVDLTDGIDHILRRHALEHVGASSSFESTLNFNIALKRRQNDDSGFGELRSDRDHRVNSAHAWKS